MANNFEKNDHRECIEIDDCDLTLAYMRGQADERKRWESKKCGTCKWYADYEGVCTNDKSPLCADFVSGDYNCIFNEPKVSE